MAVSGVDAKDPSLLVRLSTAATATEARTTLTIFAIVLTVGVALGVSLAPDNYPAPYGRLSSVIGWVYFAAWSVSFWPQVLLNYQRKSVAGLSFDFIALNLVGFACYSAYNVAYYYNDDIRAAYKEEYGSLPAVQVNDVFFALHAVVLTLVNVWQIFAYDRGGQRLSYTCMAILAALALAIGLGAALVAAGAGPWFTWLHYLLYLSYIKLAISLMKYMPQVVMNCRRRSTEGWTIYNVLLDFVGGLLSLAQLLMDCAVKGDWSGISGDPVKFGLGFVSMVFDVVFMFQHYVLYSGAAGGGGAGGSYRAVAKGGGGESDDDDADSYVVMPPTAAR